MQLSNTVGELGRIQRKLDGLRPSTSDGSFSGGPRSPWMRSVVHKVGPLPVRYASRNGDRPSTSQGFTAHSSSRGMKAGSSIVNSKNYRPSSRGLMESQGWNSSTKAKMAQSLMNPPYASTTSNRSRGVLEYSGALKRDAPRVSCENQSHPRFVFSSMTSLLFRCTHPISVGGSIVSSLASRTGSKIRACTPTPWVIKTKQVPKVGSRSTANIWPRRSQMMPS